MKMYTAWTKDAEALSKCSSGGMFFEFAKQILAEGVCKKLMEGYKQ